MLTQEQVDKLNVDDRIWWCGDDTGRKPWAIVTRIGSHKSYVAFEFLWSGYEYEFYKDMSQARLWAVGEAHAIMERI